MELKQDLYKTIFESIGNSIIIVDENSKIIMMNALTEKYFGYSRKELMGETIEKLVPPQYRKNHKSLREKYSKSPEQRSMGKGRDLLAVRKDGSELPVEIGLSPVHTEQGLLFIAPLIDISKRRVLEEERDKLFLELKNAHDNVKTLKGMCNSGV